MRSLAAANYPAPWASCRGGGTAVRVEAVVLLGVRVTAYVIINVAEYQRREAAGMAAVTDPALLDRLMDLPVATPVIDPVIWAEMADQPSGIIERSEDGTSVTRRLESPLTIEDVVVDAAAGRELRAVQDASLFAGFTRRWVAAARSRIADTTLLEAKLCGVGILDSCRRVLLPAEKPVALTMDGWSWLLQEKAYRRWVSVSGRSQAHATGSPSPATGGASAVGAELSHLRPVRR
jgi:hypothetical protein